ncbi:hypothetical protein CLAFUW7_04789, partial [Fulvia fulva]
MTTSAGDSVTIAIERFDKKTEEWEHFHDAGLDEILRDIDPNFRGRVITTNTTTNSGKPRIVRLIEQCKQLGYSGLKEAFAEWRSTQDDLRDPVVACRVCQVYHNAGHPAGKPGAGSGCPCTALQTEAEHVQPTGTSSSAAAGGETARVASRQTQSQGIPTKVSRSSPRPRRPAKSGWSKGEDSVLLDGIRKGWDAKKIVSHLPYGTTRTESAVRDRKRALLQRNHSTVSNTSPLSGFGDTTRSMYMSSPAPRTPPGRTTARSQSSDTADSIYNGAGSGKGKARLTQAMADKRVMRAQRRNPQAKPTSEGGENLEEFFARNTGGPSSSPGIALERSRLETDCQLESPAGREQDVPQTQATQSSPARQKGRRWTKEEDDIVLEALRNGWDTTAILKRLPDSAKRTPSGVRSRRIVLKRQAQYLTSPSMSRSRSTHRMVTGTRGQEPAQVTPMTPVKRAVDVVNLCEGSDEDTNEGSEADSPTAMRVRTTRCQSAGLQRRRQYFVEQDVVEGTPLEAKVAPGRPIAYVVLDRPKKSPDRIEKRRRPAGIPKTPPPPIPKHLCKAVSEGLALTRPVMVSGQRGQKRRQCLRRRQPRSREYSQRMNTSYFGDWLMKTFGRGIRSRRTFLVVRCSLFSPHTLHEYAAI